jgi:hypothetical protein
MWFDGPLRLVDHVCLASMVATGMPVTLYTYGDVPNVPDGVALRDGNDILDAGLLKRLMPIAKKDQQSWLPTVQFSDFFRVYLQKAGGGIWLDTDVLMFRSFTYDENEVYFVRESTGGIGASVFYLPSDSPIIAEYDRLIAQPDLTPNWLEFKRRVLRPFLYRVSGRPFSASDLGITIFGNEAFRQLARRHNVFDRAQPQRSFYHWSGPANEDVVKAVPWRFFYDDPDHLGLHIHRKTPAALDPEPGSLWRDALDRYT